MENMDIDKLPLKEQLIYLQGWIDCYFAILKKLSKKVESNSKN